MRDTATKKFISELAQKQYTTAKDFKMAIEKAVPLSDDPNLHVPDRSMIYEYYNGTSEMGMEFFPLLSKMFNVSVASIRAGMVLENDVVLKELEYTAKEKNIKVEELNVLSRVISMDRKTLQSFSVMLILFDLLLINLSTFHSPFVSVLLELIILYFNYVDDKRTVSTINSNDENVTFFSSVKSIFSTVVWAWNFSHENSILSSLFSHYLLFICFLFLELIIEWIAYHGKLYVSITIYLFLAIVLLMKSKCKK